ncbi:hypothetical protein T492DRAFT_913713 [Pavlovales sp. CCMP2436]|nr:hypothetical protein T492DRAFT_913713 [Pavlovales sp. CCMP2436]
MADVMVNELRRKADQGDAEAQCDLVQCYSVRHNVSQDYAKAAGLFRRAADQGHLDAQYTLGLAYREGNGRHAYAQCDIGYCYRLGKGVPQNDDEAARLYRRAAEQGHPLGQYNLAQHHAQGIGVPQDDAEAARLFRLAAEQGNAAAQFNLALLNAQGRGVPQDDRETARYLHLAAEQGLAPAQFNLANCYTRVRDGLPQDDREAARLFHLAAEQGDADAQLNFGGNDLSQLNLGRLLLEEAAAGRQTEDEEVRLEALGALSKYAHDPDVVKACCIGCGKTLKLRACSKCLTARFCGAECVRRMWAVHKQSCKTFAAARDEAAVAVDGGTNEHGAAPGANSKPARFSRAPSRQRRARTALEGALAVLACDSTLHRPALPATFNGSATAAASVGGKAAATAAALLVLESADGLDGLEPLSAEGQVARLLAEATEHVMLAQMTYKWAAWL